jgi:hypothetical protein
MHWYGGGNMDGWRSGESSAQRWIATLAWALEHLGELMSRLSQRVRLLDVPALLPRTGRPPRQRLGEVVPRVA